jgi:hypothetical protein
MIGYPGNPMAQHHLLGPGGMQHPHPQFIQYVPTSMTGPVFSTGHPVSPYAFHQNPNLAVSQAPTHQQQQQQQHQQQQHQQHQQQMNQQRFNVRANNSNSGQGRPSINPNDVQSPNQVLAATGQPILTQMSTGSPQQPPSYGLQFPPQVHPQFTANVAAMMSANPGMLMRIPPGAAMNHMMVSQAQGSPQMPMTSMSGMMDPSGGHPNMTIAWMPQQQGQAPPPHMPGVPPPSSNAIGGPHLTQPPPQPGQQQQHNPSAVANSAQVAAVQAAIAQQQQQQQQIGANGGGHTPAPSPGPMGMYASSGHQSLPQQFSAAYPAGMFMMPHGSGHPVMMSQGQGVPPPHMHQYVMQQHQGKIFSYSS